jgi:hypothetical protein
VGLTDDSDGRLIAGEVLRLRADKRLAAAWAAAGELDRLIVSSGETSLQEFFQNNPWALGLDYAQVRPRQ